MFTVVELNEKLYLQNFSATKIQNLDEFVNLHTLYLSNNAISKIENLDNLKLLKFLYVFIHPFLFHCDFCPQVS